MDYSEMTAANVEAFGESVTITDSAGVAHAGQAIIHRQEPETAPDAPGGGIRLHQARLVLADNPASYTPPFTGDSLVSQVDPNRWRVSFPLERGGAVRSYPISHVAPSLQGMIILEIG